MPIISALKTLRFYQSYIRLFWFFVPYWIMTERNLRQFKDLKNCWVICPCYRARSGFLFFGYSLYHVTGCGRRNRNSGSNLVPLLPMSFQGQVTYLLWVYIVLGLKKPSWGVVKSKWNSISQGERIQGRTYNVVNAWKMLIPPLLCPNFMSDKIRYMW